MAAPYTHTKLLEIADSAPTFGIGEIQEARFAKAALDAEDTGLSLTSRRWMRCGWRRA